jgi:hypothetical protein
VSVNVVAFEHQRKKVVAGVPKGLDGNELE